MNAGLKTAATSINDALAMSCGKTHIENAQA